MSRVSTPQELKRAVKNKEEMIVVVGELAEKLRGDSQDKLKKGVKKTGNVVSKGLLGMGAVITVATGLMPVASLTIGALGTILTNNEIKKYDVEVPNEGSYIKLKRKKGLFN